MNPDLEDLGGLVTAGLAAHEADAVSLPDRHAGDAPGSCLNCGGPLTGAYCTRCGQPAHLHRSLLHLGEEFVHGVLHFDAKGVRTVPLLFFRPGLLTRRYIEGQRTRYVSPMALFLFCIFLTYFVFSLVSEEHGSLVNVKFATPAEAKVDIQQALAQAQDDVDKAKADLDAARKSGDGVQAAERAYAAATLGQKLANLSSQAADAALKAQADANAKAGKAEGPVETTVDAGEAVKTQLAAAAKAIPDVPGWKGRVRKSLSNPDLLFYKLESIAHKYSFMLIPISLPFLWLMFAWRPGVTMYDHAIFSLYSLSFMSLFFCLVALCGLVGLSSLAGLAVVLVPPVHMFVQLRGTYSLSIFSALWRTAALLAICGTAFVLFLAFIVVMLFR
jgi:Protein of unknown function (DUF3667)